MTSELDVVRVQAHNADLGASSETLIWVLGSSPEVRAYGEGALGQEGGRPPGDTSDVGRCVRLLDAMAAAGHDWRGRIGEMAAVASWRPLVERWPEIEAAYRADEAAQRAWVPEYQGRGRKRARAGFPPSKCWWLVHKLRFPSTSHPYDNVFGVSL